MAVTTVVIVASLVAVASAGFPGFPWPENDDVFPPLPVPMFRFPPIPRARSMNGMPNFPMPFFPPFPKFKFPKMPSFEDIANAKPGQGGTYSGVVVSTKSEMRRDDEGNLVKTGGSTILINNDGNVKIEKSGDSPPEIATRNNGFFEFDAPQPKPLNHNNRFKKFEFNFEPLNPERLKKIVPGENEYFKGKSVRSHSYTSNVNGVVNQEASVIRVENDNGKVNEETISFRKGPER
ncbi:seroin-like [Helicoverpa zea]|uniref:seroin-like n=1 Tax=Helicoverpa zea TaxID=7113 RepID=UPI001F55FB3B|nr:seroin-like [Helicoverpa zea]XP_047022315.1 seroin-like [Helicoverpa zea]XP_047022324.1 seroin-like [Helicoverpa zea]